MTTICRNPCLTVSAAAAFAAIAAAAPATAFADEAIVAAGRVPTAINAVATGGFWNKPGSGEGVYRVVVTAAGIEHVAHKLFIQWLANDEATQGYRLVRTVPVKELNDNAGVTMTVTTDFGDINFFLIKVAVTGRGGDKRNYEITATADGAYALKQR